MCVYVGAIPCCCRGVNVDQTRKTVYRALDTLPEADQATISAATSQLDSVRFALHSNPTASPTALRHLGSIVQQLRVSCLSTYVSHVTCRTMMGHLDGSRPLADWRPLEEVRGWSEKCCMVGVVTFIVRRLHTAV